MHRLSVYLLSGWRQYSATLAPPLCLSSLWLKTVFCHTCTASLSTFSLAGDSILPHLHRLSVYLLSGWRQYSATLAPPLCLSSLWLETVVCHTYTAFLSTFSLAGDRLLPHLHRLSVYLLSGWKQSSATLAPPLCLPSLWLETVCCHTSTVSLCLYYLWLETICLNVYLLSCRRRYATTLAPPLYVYLLCARLETVSTCTTSLFLCSLWLETICCHTGNVCCDSQT